MRPIRDIDEMENPRIVPVPNWPNAVTVKRDAVEPEPVGTIVLLPFRIIGYDRDCDGSLMARMDNVMRWEYGDDRLAETGWEVTHIGLSPDDGFVVTEDELVEMFEQCRHDAARNTAGE